MTKLTIEEIIYQIHKRKNGYLFNKAEYSVCKNNFTDSNCKIHDNCRKDKRQLFYKKYTDEEFLKEPKDSSSNANASICPFQDILNPITVDKSQEINNPMRYVQCYLRSKEVKKFLKEIGFIASAPLFRDYQIANEGLKYLDNYWYPFYTGESLVQLPTFIQEDNESNKIKRRIRFKITSQRNKRQLNSACDDSSDSGPFSIFKEVANSKSQKDREFRFIDVCDGSATFMLIYFIVYWRLKAVEALPDTNERNIDENFAGELTWLYTDNDESFLRFLDKNTRNNLKLYGFDREDNEIVDKDYHDKSKPISKWKRTSTWQEDLEFLGLVNQPVNTKQEGLELSGLVNQSDNTERFNHFETWYSKDPHDSYIDNLVKKLKNILSIEKDGIQLSLSKEHINKFLECKNFEERFILQPKMHLIVRGYLTDPIRWTFIPFNVVTNSNSKQEVNCANVIDNSAQDQGIEEYQCTSGVILLHKDSLKSKSYDENIEDSKNEILQRIKKLLPLLTAVYVIEEQSLDMYVHNRMIIDQKIKDNNARQATISRIMNRNSAHHLLSHVEQYTSFEAVCDRLKWDWRWVANADNEEKNSSALYSLNKMRKRYRSYINTRYEFMAQNLSTSGRVNRFLYADIIKPLLENTLLIDNIAKDENLSYCLNSKDLEGMLAKKEADHYQIFELNYAIAKFQNKNINIVVRFKGEDLLCKYSVYDDGEKDPIFDYKSNEIPYYMPSVLTGESKTEKHNVKLEYPNGDLKISVPGSYGEHCLYSILENHIRNLAKCEVTEENTQSNLKILLEVEENATDSNYFKFKLFSNKKTLDPCSGKLPDNMNKAINDEYDLLDFDNISKGIADIRVNALFLSGKELNATNLQGALTAKNKNGMLVYEFDVRKAYFVAEICSGNKECLIEESKDKGWHIFKSIDDYKEKLNEKQTPYKFLIIHNKNDLKELTVKQKPLNIILVENNSAYAEEKIKVEKELWELYSKQQGILDFQLITNYDKTDGFESFNKYDDDKTSNSKGKIYEFARHKVCQGRENLPPESTGVFYELIEKNNPDFDIFHGEKLKEIKYEVICAANKKVLIIDERIAQRTKKIKPNLLNSTNGEGVGSEYFNHAKAANVFIVTHINEKPLHITLKGSKFLSIVYDHEKNEFVIDPNVNDQSVKYDILVIHRKLVSSLMALIPNEKGDSYTSASRVDKFVKTLEQLADNIYITTGSGSLSDLPDGLVEKLKYIPFGVINKSLNQAVAKIDLMRNLN